MPCVQSLARSQDQGESWQTGAALSSGDPADLIWDECTLTEMRNGSVLMSARIDDPKNTDPHHPDTNATRVGTSRGFARSDDGVPAADRLTHESPTTLQMAWNLLMAGGATWAEQWTLWERQPEIPDAPCR